MLQEQIYCLHTINQRDFPNTQHFQNQGMNFRTSRVQKT